MKSLYFKTPQEWRTWLQSNHDMETEVWLIFFKKDTRKPTLDYEAAVEEALCFGWIDSIIKKIDESKFARKFTPRKDSSKWSAINKKRVEKLIQSARMTPVGLSKVEAAQKSGRWDEPDRPTRSFDPPEDFTKALNQNRKAKEFFEQLAPTYQKQFIGWISIAKRQETKEKRIRESIQLLEKGEKLGLR
ncbi:MAG: YdeI family protein [bacterium]